MGEYKNVLRASGAHLFGMPIADAGLFTLVRAQHNFNEPDEHDMRS